MENRDESEIFSIDSWVRRDYFERLSRKVEIPRILQTSRNHPLPSILRLKKVLRRSRSPLKARCLKRFWREVRETSLEKGGEGIIVVRCRASTDFSRGTIVGGGGKNLHEIEIPWKKIGGRVGINFIRVDEIYVASRRRTPLTKNLINELDTFRIPSDKSYPNNRRGKWRNRC